jgi:hypothetical protein
VHTQHTLSLQASACIHSSTCSHTHSLHHTHRLHPPHTQLAFTPQHVTTQGPLLSHLNPAALQSTLWALNFHVLGHLQPNPTPQQPTTPAPVQHPSSRGPLLVASTLSPSPALLEALCSCLGRTLRDAHEAGKAAFAPSQLVSMAATLACFGHEPRPDTTRALAATLQSSALQQQQEQQQQRQQGVSSVLSSGELIAALWSQARFRAVPPPGYTASILACLQGGLTPLTQLQVGLTLTIATQRLDRH